tara:strand:+ start:3418 stop:3591 length:174 start_codon:yes stop_codon:yes gene_type:complete
MAITSAKYVKNTNTNQNECIKLVRNGKTWFVPLNTDNKDYQEIQEWVDAGNSITAAD